MKMDELYKIYLQHPHVQTDTRKLQEGDLYVALKGANFDGNQFAKQALDMGASYAIIDDETYYINEKTILVPDGLQCLQALAHFHRKQFDIPLNYEIDYKKLEEIKRKKNKNPPVIPEFCCHTVCEIVPNQNHSVLVVKHY